MDHLDKEVIESLSEPAKRVFKSLDYRSKQRMLKKAREMAKAEKMKRRKKSRFKKKGIEKLNKGKKQKKGSSSKSERVLFSIHETRELMVQSMHLMLLGSSVADASYEERNADHTEDAPIRLSKETARKGAHTAVGGMKTLVHKNLQSREKKKGCKKVNGEIGTGCSIGSKSRSTGRKIFGKDNTKCCSGSSGKSGCMDSTSFDYSFGSYRGSNWSSGWLRRCC